MKDPYVYEGTNILINLAGIKDQNKLDDFESTLVQAAVINLSRTFRSTGSAKDIFFIHKELFKEIYAWAGEKRTINVVKREPVLGGESVMYIDKDYINVDIEKLDRKIESINWDAISFEDKISETADIISELWRIHPFREGNTRAVSVFLYYFMKDKGLALNNEFISEHAKYFRNALVLNSLDENSNPEPFKAILEDAATDAPLQEDSKDKYGTINGYDLKDYRYDYHSSSEKG